MEEWCIVAIPEEDDPVWRLSSEKIPHCTLLYLGPQEDPERARQITMQLQHTVSTSLRPFGASVHSRGKLGPKDADVLFFDQADIPQELYEFRSLLLKDDTIRKCYESVDQYPSWNPHLTMGYPTSPAKKPKNEWGDGTVRTVFFDRIALWIADYDGPTFTLSHRRRLVSPEHDSMYDSGVMAMSDQTKEFLAHRKPEPTGYVPSYFKKPAPSNLKHHGIGAKPKSHMNPLMASLRTAIKMAVEAGASVSEDIRYLKHADDGGLLKRNPIHDQYVRENQLLLGRSLQHAVGGKPSETANLRYDIATLPNGDWVVSTVDTMAHTGTAETTVRPHRDALGMITDYTIMADDVSQTDLRYAIKHYGVKGMKWGVRRKSKGSDGGDGGGDSAVSPRQQKRIDAKAAKVAAKEAKVAARKQERAENWARPVTDDAKNAAAKRGRTKKHGTDALSNDELKELVTRMNLEQQLANLQANEKAAKARKSGRAYVSDVLKDAGKTAAQEAVRYAMSEAMKSAFEKAGEAQEERRASRQYQPPQPALPPGRRAIGR